MLLTAWRADREGRARENQSVVSKCCENSAPSFAPDLSDLHRLHAPARALTQSGVMGTPLSC